MRLIRKHRIQFYLKDLNEGDKIDLFVDQKEGIFHYKFELKNNSLIKKWKLIQSIEGFKSVYCDSNTFEDDYEYQKNGFWKNGSGDLVFKLKNGGVLLLKKTN